MDDGPLVMHAKLKIGRLVENEDDLASSSERFRLFPKRRQYHVRTALELGHLGLVAAEWRANLGPGLAGSLPHGPQRKRENATWFRSASNDLGVLGADLGDAAQ
jgi:hypothetical protein